MGWPTDHTLKTADLLLVNVGDTRIGTTFFLLCPLLAENHQQHRSLSIAVSLPWARDYLAAAWASTCSVFLRDGTAVFTVSVPTSRSHPIPQSDWAVGWKLVYGLRCAFLLFTLTSASFLVLIDASIIAPVSVDENVMDNHSYLLADNP